MGVLRREKPSQRGRVFFGPLGAQAVVQLAADAAHRDDVAFLSDLGNAGNGPPFLGAAEPEMSEPPQMLRKRGPSQRMKDE